MSAVQAVEATVRRAGQRRRWQRAWRGLWRGVLLGGLAWLLGLGLYKLLPLPQVILAVAGGVAVLAMAIGFLTGFWRRESLFETARWVDESQRLKERISTAIEVSHDPRAGDWSRLVVDDAQRHAAALDLRRILPWHLPRSSRWALLVLALGAGLGFAPEYRSPELLRKQHDKENIRETGRQLAEVTRRTLERRAPALDSTRQAVKSVGELGNQLQRNPVTRNEALRELSRMTDKVREEARELAKNPALRSIERATRTGDQNPPGKAEELERQIESLQKAMGNSQAKPDALEKLRQELQKAQQTAKGLTGRDSQGAEAGKENLAKALASLAKQSQDLGAMLPSLEEAIQALEAGQLDQVLKDLQVAEQDLEKLQQMAQALQQMQQQAMRVGKDLAEQLKNGQAEAAVGTLQKMVNQLKSGELSEEQLKAMAEEVNKAIDPAQPYGKVADFLKQGLKQLQGGQKPGAAQSLADAAKELESLMQQLADAQDLNSTLDALKKAQVCIGNGLGWSQCQGPGRPGFKPGGKPGRGVGTWAEEEGWIDTPENTGLWDNSGVERPDREERGITDRGEGEAPDGLLPTKVKGQFQPGAQMPSITLKGVSIKGQSKVAIQEATTSAQSEAQSALSQDQVPRAYQGAVKDYFNDLPKP